MVAYFLVICFCSFFALRQDDPFKKYQGPIYRYPQIQNWSFGFADKFRVSAQKMLAYVFVIFSVLFLVRTNATSFKKKVQGTSIQTKTTIKSRTGFLRSQNKVPIFNKKIMPYFLIIVFALFLNRDNKILFKNIRFQNQAAKKSTKSRTKFLASQIKIPTSNRETVACFW